MAPYRRTDVIALARDTFPDVRLDDVLAILDLYGTESYENERDRVHLAILTLCEGDIDRLLDYTQTAKIDYRDVLAWSGVPPADTP